MKSSFRYVLMGIAYLLVLLGFIGIFLPIWPTVPFLIVAAFLFYHSSPKALEWLVNHRVLGPYIRDFQKTGIIPTRVKIISISMMWFSMFFSLYFLPDKLWMKLTLVICIITGTFFIIFFKWKPTYLKDEEATKKNNSEEESNNEC